jgi:hypothetical protein|tara:strand:- start:22 stop:915 length:894 start_codon:yes stop_codon:yes gene_type:complete
MDISALKSRRTDINKLVEAAQESAGGTKFEREDTSHIWKPTVDKAGNGYAVVRFLPSESDVPWTRYWDHGFKGPTGKWYIEKSLTSLGQTDPLGELNSKLWNSGSEEDRTTVRQQKRRLHYVTNILIVSDPSSPQNEGKVFLYQFGKKIFDKIQDLMQPQFPGETPVDPFDLWNGADFQLKIRQVEGYRNYDRSEFKAPAPLAEGDEVQLQAIMNQIHDINYYVDPANYKTYDQLQTKLFEVLGETAPRTVKEEVALDTVAAPATTTAPPPVQTAEETDQSGDDDAMSYFQKLANAD